jgi:hypothetical protein
MLLHPLPDKWDPLVHLIVHASDPTSRFTASANNAKAASHPQRSDSGRYAIDMYHLRFLAICLS